MWEGGRVGGSLVMSAEKVCGWGAGGVGERGHTCLTGTSLFWNKSLAQDRDQPWYTCNQTQQSSDICLEKCCSRQPVAAGIIWLCCYCAV